MYFRSSSLSTDRRIRSTGVILGLDHIMIVTPDIYIPETSCKASAPKKQKRLDIVEKSGKT